VLYAGTNAAIVRLQRKLRYETWRWWLCLPSNQSL
jgi:hypothetical protein